MSQLNRQMFRIVAYKGGRELGRIFVSNVASAKDALAEGRWILAEQLRLNLHDISIEFRVEEQQDQRRP